MKYHVIVSPLVRLILRFLSDLKNTLINRIEF